ncbi:MAG: SWIM zinc finger family protein [Candidatus Heimdallarchaeota archaeon]
MQEDDKRVQRFLTKTRQVKDGLTLSNAQENRNWWTDQWIELIEKLESGNRLTQGKSVAKNGQVIYIKVQKGFIIAKVQGERLKPYQIRIEVNSISEEIWGDILTEIASNAYLVAKLFANKLPEQVNEIFTEKNTSLISEQKIHYYSSWCPNHFRRL